MKRLSDFLIALISIVIVSPILLAVAISIKLTTKDPVFFNQIRIGKNGAKFSIHKLRTMRLHKASSSIAGTNDNFITPVGNILRKTKLDELPQLLNIIKGQMSIVGPRPDVPGYYDMLEGEDRIILNFRPGLTGLDSMVYPFEEKLLANQKDPVEYYTKVIWPHKVRLNRWYTENWTFTLDLKIIINTATQILFKKQIISINYPK